MTIALLGFSIILFSLGIAPPSSLGTKRRIQSSDSKIFLRHDSVSASGGIWVTRMWYLSRVNMLLAEQELEECINVHRSHPSLQPNAILLHFLHGLSFGHIGCLDSKIEC
jgi:hypothetical protein